MAKVDRAAVSSVVLPVEVSESLISGAVENSVVAGLATTFPMTTNRKSFTEAEVGDANVFWVGEGARKTTDAPAMSGQTWTLDAAEIAVIIPIDENVYDDSTVDLFELYADKIETAFARKLDKATLFGEADWPSDWNAPTGPTDGSLYELCKTRGFVFEEDVSPTDAELLALITGTGAVAADGALSAIEESGYDPDSVLMRAPFKSRLRHMKDLDGRYIFGDAVAAGVPPSLFGLPIQSVPTKGARIDAAKASLIFGDFAPLYLGTLQDVKYKVFDQGTITDGAGAVTYSLMENDMIALRMTARVAFKIIVDDSADGETIGAASDLPFSIVGPLGAATA